MLFERHRELLSICLFNKCQQQPCLAKLKSEPRTQSKYLRCLQVPVAPTVTPGLHVSRKLGSEGEPRPKPDTSVLDAVVPRT